MRNKLINELVMMLNSEGAYTDRIKAKLTMLLSNYEVTERTTEIAVYDGNDIEKYVKLFMINKQVAGRTERTIKLYMQTLRMFFADTPKNPVEITADDIKLWLAKKELNDGVSKTGLSNYLRCISSFYTWMVREEYILKNPINKIDPIKIPKKKKHAYSEMEIEILRKNIKNLRDKAVFEVLLSTWCRVSEVAGMDRTKLEADGSIEVLGKGQKTRKVYLNAAAKVALDDYLQTRIDDNDAMFVSLDRPFDRISANWIEKFVRDLGRHCGIKNVHPHRFRRTGATFALRKGMPIEQVSKLLGHESIDTTQIYLDINETEIALAHKRFV